MSTLTVTSKGQVTLSQDLLNHLGVRPGEKVTAEKLPDGRIALKAERPAGNISDVFGLLKREKRSFPVDRGHRRGRQTRLGRPSMKIPVAGIGTR